MVLQTVDYTALRNDRSKHGITKQLNLIRLKPTHIDPLSKVLS